MKKGLLINWAFYRPVGHLLEALQHARGYYAANHDVVDISLLVNAASPSTLVKACPWITGVYPIDFAEIESRSQQAPSLQAVPPTWDYIVNDPRIAIQDPTIGGRGAEALITTQAVVQEYLRAAYWSGSSRGWECRWNTTGLLGPEDPLPYAANARFSLPIPADAQLFAQQYRHHGPTICVLPGGGSSGLQQNPSLDVWNDILMALIDKFPDLRVYITGLSPNVTGQIHTRGLSSHDSDVLARRLPFVTNCFDIGMWNQVALIAACDILLAPHTGFAFIGQFVGTPWLALSRCPWPEYLFNGIPFYSVIPDCDSYPAQWRMDCECNQRIARREKTVCMEDDKVRDRIPDIIRGAQFLLDPSVTYEQAIRVHVGNLQRQRRNLDQFQFFVD
jgi:hypothetical protein